MIQNDQINAVEGTALEVDAADGVLANDTTVNGPLTVVAGWYQTTGGGQIYFFSDGSYDYVSAAGFSGTDTVQYTAIDASSDLAGAATLSIDVAPTALLPFVSIGTQLGVRTVVSAGFPQVGDGIDTSASGPVALTGGGYVISVNYLDQAQGAVTRVETYGANDNLLGTFDPGLFIYNMQTVALTDGDYALAWDTYGSSSSPRTGNVELFNAAGTSVAGPITLDLPAGAAGISKIAALPGGGFVVLQEDVNGQLNAWSFNAVGVGGGQPVAIGPSGVFRPSLAVLPDGEIVFAQVGSGNQVEVQRYDALGNPIGSEILPPSDGHNIDSGSMSVTPMPKGGFAVSWASLQAQLGNGSRLVEETHVQLVDADGNLVGNQATSVVTYSTIFGSPHPYVTPLADGGFVIYWRGVFDPGQVGEIQAYDASGNAAGGITQFPSQTAFGTVFLRVFALPEGGFAVAPSTADAPARNLSIYDNNGNSVGDVPMEYAGDGSVDSYMYLTNLPDGKTLVLYDEEDTASSRATVQTINFDTATPVIQTGITFRANTTGTIPVVVSIPDPDGSEIVQSIDVTGIPAGWTLSDLGASAVFDGTQWTVTGNNLTHGGEIDLSLTPPTNFAGSEALTVTAQVVDTGNGSQNQSVPVTFNVTVTPPPAPLGTSAEMIMGRASDGTYEIYDIGNNAILAAYQLGQISTQYQVVGVGGFNGTDFVDMLIQSPTTGVFQLYDVSHNDIAGSTPMGQVGPEWAVAGFGDFSGNANETDMLMRNTAGAFELFDIANNGYAGFHALGTIGLNQAVAGFGDFSGNANETDMLMRDTTTGAFNVYDINHNQLGSPIAIGQVALSWQVAGIGNFSGNANETDILMRNSTTGAFDIYDVSNNQLGNPIAIGQVGMDWTVAGFGNFSGNANETDMLMRSSAGAFEIFDINNNQFAGFHAAGQVGPEWQVSGISGTAQASQLAQALATFAPNGSAAIGGTSPPADPQTPPLSQIMVTPPTG
jgi:hypothetical protein